MRVIVLHERDNVGVAKEPLSPGMLLASAGGIAVSADVPAMHKIAIRDIPDGEKIRKFSQVIGYATQAIAAGEHVHIHNCAYGAIDADAAPCTEARPTRFVPAAQRPTFMGYMRESGRAGTRNYLGIVTSVNCSATVARHITAAIEREGLLEKYPNVDGIVPIVHGRGCGMSGHGHGYDSLKRLLSGYAGHPNFGGVLLVGLGCEVMQSGEIAKAAGLAASRRFRHLIIQREGGTGKTIKAGIAAVKDMLPLLEADRREPISVSELTMALQCGASDAYSGIAANPALGKAVDLLVENGGTGILSETTEIYGAEHLLTRRAETPEIAAQLLDLIAWWKAHAASTGEGIDNNPSPGNKAGGLTTILEKSLGAQSKGGTTNLVGVYQYGEMIDKRGFVIMDSPGFDPASVTGQVASGANIVCFTTGRGSAFGFKPVPSIKLASSSALFERLNEDMDINCGTVADGLQTLDEKGAEILEHVIAVASGQPTKSEMLGYGDSEFVPWIVGTML
jgi:altronate hydrolase